MTSLQKFAHAAIAASHIAIDWLFQVDLPILLTDRRPMVFHRLHLENVHVKANRFGERPLRMSFIYRIFAYSERTSGARSRCAVTS